MKKIIDNINQLSDRQSLFVSIATLLVIGILDHYAGPELSTALFYLLPIAMATRYSATSFSYLICLLSAVIWLITDYTSGQTYSSPAIFIWNVVMRLVLFLFVARLLTSLQQNQRHFQYLATIDPLTGALNRRGFLARTEEELNRAKRFKKEFSIAFVDLDNFKKINDSMGHQVGDQLLQTVVRTMQNQLRTTDIVGRFGGDEFAVLFVESNQQQAKEAFDKCHAAMKLAMQQQGWQIVSFSCSVITFLQFDLSTDNMLDLADKWMYQVKLKGKNRVIYRYSEQTDSDDIDLSLKTD